METPFHSTPVIRTDPAPLPEGVTRCSHTTPDVTLDTCHAVRITLRTLDGSRQFSLIAWRGRPTQMRPIDKPRITALRLGDWVRWRRGVYEVAGVEVWR
ncbi:hypothetical protein KOR34_04710 [Posidoniimonas corsicana]|uniref:Uncharacterized protein n=1 Tax=Posidoniimonas corsicana TaxID=1938618 RepID=A0A5C5VAK1_9BACT|nr:hypothetical protein [Posidoniimonas corsicana]TWT35578.1 hypothetical protein KOR34_04710 [Posidoniimonas corsicana]